MGDEWTEWLSGQMVTPAFRDEYEQAGIDIQLGAEVRRRREARGMTQRQLARLLRTKQTAVARLELGGVTPGLRTLRRLSKALGVQFIVDADAVRTAGGSISGSHLTVAEGAGDYLAGATVMYYAGTTLIIGGGTTMVHEGGPTVTGLVESKQDSEWFSRGWLDFQGAAGRSGKAS